MRFGQAKAKLDNRPLPLPSGTMSATMFENKTLDETFAFLRSPAGGALQIRDDDESPYAVVYYNKKSSDMSMPHVSAFRSVIWDKTANKPLFVAPPRSAPFSTLTGTDFTTEEFIDGVMINMFYDRIQGKWCLATRTQLGAMNRYFGKRTFADLFWETFASAGLVLEDLDTATTYSWVLQHPEERIVVAPAYGIPIIKLIHVVGLLTPKLIAFIPVSSCVLKTLEEVKDFVQAEGKRRGAQFMGLIIRSGGNRYKLRSAEYEAARQLRGNQPKRAYTWLERWTQGSLPAYLRLYPEEACDAEAVIATYKAATQEVHDLYLKVYRKKELPLGQAPQKYRKLLWDAHKARKGAYFPDCRTFMNEQDTARKLWIVNYEVRYSPTTTEELGRVTGPDTGPEDGRTEENMPGSEE